MVWSLEEEGKESEAMKAKLSLLAVAREKEKWENPDEPIEFLALQWMSKEAVESLRPQEEKRMMLSMAKRALRAK